MAETAEATERWHVGTVWGRKYLKWPIYPDRPTLNRLKVAEAYSLEDAKDIVGSHNAHDALTARCERLEAACRAAQESVDAPVGTLRFAQARAALRDALEAAL